MNHLKITDLDDNEIRVSYSDEFNFFVLKDKTKFNNPLKNEIINLTDFFVCGANLDNEKDDKIISIANSIFREIFINGLSRKDIDAFFKILEKHPFDVCIDSRTNNLEFLCLPWEKVFASSKEFSHIIWPKGVNRLISGANILSSSFKSKSINNRILLAIQSIEGVTYIPMCKEIISIIGLYTNLDSLERLMSIISEKGSKIDVKTGKTYEYFDILFLILYSFINNYFQSYTNALNETEPDNEILKIYLKWESNLYEKYLNNSNVIIIEIREDELIKAISKNGDAFPVGVNTFFILKNFLNYSYQWMQQLAFHNFKLAAKSDEKLSKLKAMEYEAKHATDHGFLDAAYLIYEKILNMIGSDNNLVSDEYIFKVNFLLCDILQCQKRWEEACIWLKECLNNYKKMGMLYGISNLYYMMGSTLKERHQFTQAEYYINYGISIAKELNSEEEIAEGYFQLGLISEEASDLNKAESHYKESLIISDRLGNSLFSGTAFYQLSSIALKRQHYRAAIKWIRKARKIFENYKDQSFICSTYHQFALIYREMGKFEVALNFCKKALSIAKQLEWKDAIGDEYHHLGVIFQHKGDFETAKEFHYESINIFRNLGLISCIADNYHELGVIETANLKFDKAIKWHIKALRIFFKLGIDESVAIEFHQLGVVQLKRGNLKIAQKMHRKSLKIFKKLKLERYISTEYHKLGKIAEIQKKLKAAKNLHLISYRINKKLELKRYEAIESHHLGIVAWKLGRLDEAMEWHLSALNKFKNLKNKLFISKEFFQLGLISIELNEYEQAENYLLEALKADPHTTNSRNIADVWYQLARISVYRNHFEDALKYYINVLQKNEESAYPNGSIIFGLAEIMSAIGEEDFSLLWSKSSGGYQHYIKIIKNAKAIRDSTKFNGFWTDIWQI